jgi:hypothetical protein
MDQGGAGAGGGGASGAGAAGFSGVGGASGQSGGGQGGASGASGEGGDAGAAGPGGSGGAGEGGAAGDGSSGGCGEGQSDCGSGCVDLQSDPTNCGKCGNTCVAPPGYEATCQEGICGITCGGGQTLCGVACFDTKKDPQNCGACGVTCKEGEVCSQGKCSEGCVPPLIACGASCVDPASDVTNCGGCGKVCMAPPGAVPVCAAGECDFACAFGWLCGSGCVDGQNDPKNCGGCGKACSGGQVCSGGVCKASMTCGNGKVDPGEECDGFIPLNCAGFVQEGFGGSPVCSPSCKVDLSACAYCGNGIRDEHESCEGSDLGGVTCNSLGAGDGQIACKNCQYDLSKCAIPVCGFKAGLDTTARWPAEGGCMARPGQSSFLGPASAGQISSGSLMGDLNFLPALVITNDERTLFFMGTTLVGWDGENLFIAHNGSQAVSTSPVLLPLDGMLRVSDTNVGYLVRIGLSKWESFGSTPSAGGVATTSVVFFQVGVQQAEAFFARQDGSFWRAMLAVESTQITKLFTDPVGLRGTMAFDASRNRIYVPRDCSAFGVDCKVLAVEPDTGSVVWEQPMTSVLVPAPCHAAVASSGTVYTACGPSVRFFHPDKPGQFTAGFNANVDSVALAPALASDGSVYLLFDGSNPVLMVTKPQLKILWSHSLSAKPLAPPLLDRESNVYLCTQQGVTSLDKSGSVRWSYSFLGGTLRCAMALSGEGQLDVITNNRAIRIK